MLVFCRSEDKACLAPLIIGLPGLLLVDGLDSSDAASVADLIAAHNLQSTFALRFERDELQLCKADRHGRFDRDSVSLLPADLQRRSGTGTEIRRACLGQTPAAGVRILDVFAGWGMDAWALAAAGARVTCVELQPPMVALLRDAARRVPTELAARIDVVHGEAIDHLLHLQQRSFDVIYLDPMFPPRKKGALPGKRLQWLAEIAGNATIEVDELVSLARAKAGKQVVLKRRRKDPLVGVPARQVVGTSVRYDIYVPQQSSH